MPINYKFKDSKAADNVAKALLFVSKFSKKDAYVRFSDNSVVVVWGGPHRAYNIHAETYAPGMFKDANQRHYGLDHNTTLKVNPNSLGRTLKGNPSQDRVVEISIMKPNKLRVTVRSKPSDRTIVHTLQGEVIHDDIYRNTLIEEIETNFCHYDTRSYVENVNRFKHIIDSFAKLNSPRIYIWSKQVIGQGNDLTIQAQTQGASVHVSLSDLDSGYKRGEEDDTRRNQAGVNIETKKLAFFLSGLFIREKARVCFEIEHNKWLKITLNSGIPSEKSYQSLLLQHTV